jgi:hypothetical protein
MNPTYLHTDEFSNIACTGMEVEDDNDRIKGTPRRTSAISRGTSIASSRTEPTIATSQDDVSQGFPSLPVHAIESGSNTCNRNNPIGATLDLRSLRGNVRRKLLDHEVEQVITSLIAKLAKYPDAPKKPEDLCIVKRIDEKSVESERFSSSIYSKGKRFYKRVAETKEERDELIRKYFNQKQHKPKQEKQGVLVTSEFAANEGTASESLPPVHNMMDCEPALALSRQVEFPSETVPPSHLCLRMFTSGKRIQLDEYCQQHGIRNIRDNHATRNIDVLLRCAEAARDDMNDEDMVLYFCGFIDRFWPKDSDRPAMDIDEDKNGTNTDRRDDDIDDDEYHEGDDANSDNDYDRSSDSEDTIDQCTKGDSGCAEPTMYMDRLCASFPPLPMMETITGTSSPGSVSPLSMIETWPTQGMPPSAPPEISQTYPPPASEPPNSVLSVPIFADAATAGNNLREDFNCNQTMRLEDGDDDDGSGDGFKISWKETKANQEVNRNHSFQADDGRVQSALSVPALYPTTNFLPLTPNVEHHPFFTECEVRELPTLAIDLCSILGKQSNSVGVSFILRRICGQHRSLTSDFDLYHNVYGKLVQELACYDNAPCSSDELFFVRKIYDPKMMDAHIQSKTSGFYQHGSSYYERILNKRERDETVREYFKRQLDLLRTNPDKNDACTNVESTEYFEILKWVKSGCPLENNICAVAAEHGNFSMLKLAHWVGCPWDSNTCANAAKNGHLEVLQWARSNGCFWDKETCSKAAWSGKLKILRFASENGCPWDADCTAQAAKNGQLDVLMWARSQGCEWDERTCASAAKNGHLAILQWAHRNGCPWDATTCAFAAKQGHFEILKWARANGCPWDERTCALAAENGNLVVLQWARCNGCPWDATTCAIAVENGHLEILKWASANGCPFDARTNSTGSMNTCSTDSSRTVDAGTIYIPKKRCKEKITGRKNRFLGLTHLWRTKSDNK